MSPLDEAPQLKSTKVRNYNIAQLSHPFIPNPQCAVQLYETQGGCKAAAYQLSPPHHDPKPCLAAPASSATTDYSSSQLNAPPLPTDAGPPPQPQTRPPPPPRTPLQTPPLNQKTLSSPKRTTTSSRKPSRTAPHQQAPSPSPSAPSAPNTSACKQPPTQTYTRAPTKRAPKASRPSSTKRTRRCKTRSDGPNTCSRCGGSRWRKTSGRGRRTRSC